jgi:hypothetical protein
MENRDQQSRWVTYTGRRVGTLQLSQADRLSRSRAATRPADSDGVEQPAARADQGMIPVPRGH